MKREHFSKKKSRPAVTLPAPRETKEIVLHGQTVRVKVYAARSANAKPIYELKGGEKIDFRGDGRGFLKDVDEIPKRRR